MSTMQLSPAQHAILAYAIQNTDGRIEWFPDNIKGGAKKKVLDGLFNRALITTDGTNWFVAAEGYDALGCERPAPATVTATAEEHARETPPVAAQAEEAVTPRPRIRENSKQATVIGMLQRPEGATVQQICEATGWQAHTVRGTFAGALKKKLGFNVVSDKAQGGERIYRIAA
ncbi:MAG: DUF3489 domain-containing protein [Betaproteobacteria bacterium]|nr:DUF3489 domain-containing protein [Betaproteobacteria bacterium]